MGRTFPRRPSGSCLELRQGVEGGIALLLTLGANHLTSAHEVAQSGSHLLSGDAKLTSHLLVGHRLTLAAESVENLGAELLNLGVNLLHTRTSRSLLEGSNLPLAELDDLGIISHDSGDAVIEVLLGDLLLGHFFLLFWKHPASCPLSQSPVDRLVILRGGHPLVPLKSFFLSLTFYIYYIIFFGMVSRVFFNLSSFFLLFFYQTLEFPSLSLIILYYIFCSYVNNYFLD